MKKIISLIASVSMLFSLAVSVSAANANKVDEASKANPVITTKYTGEVQNGDITMYQFDVTYDVGTELTAHSANMFGQATVNGIQSVEVIFDVDPAVWNVGAGVFVNATTGAFPTASASYNAVEGTIVFTKSFSAGNEFVTNNTGSLFTFFVSPVDADLDGSTVKMDYVSALIQIRAYSAGTLTNTTEYSTLSSKDYDIKTVFGEETEDDDDEPVLVEVAGLTGDLEKYNDGFLMQKIVKADLTEVATSKKIMVKSLDKTTETKTMERTLADALGLDGETTTVDISKLVVVVMVSEDKADDYALGFDFELVD